MSHGITELDQILLVGQPAWHGLGIVVEGAPSLEEARKLSGLDWEPVAHPAFYGQHRRDYPGSMIVRSDKPDVELGAVGVGYRVFTNSELFALASAVQERTGAPVETAGSVGRGGKVFLLLRTPSADLSIPARGRADGSMPDRSLAYVALITGHDGSTALRVHGTSVRVVCANTIRASEQDVGHSIAGIEGTAGLEAIRHGDRDFERKLEILKASILSQADTVARLHRVLERSVEVRLSSEQRAEVFYQIWAAIQDGPFDAAAAKQFVTDVDLCDDTAQFGLSGTLYSAAQSLTGWADHRRDGVVRTAGSRLVNQSALKVATMTRVSAMVGA